MKRYYISPILGSGSEEDPFRSAVSEHNVPATVTFPPFDRATLSYTKPYCIAVVDTKNHVPLTLDPRLLPLPDFPMDGKLNAMRTDTANAMTSGLTARGFVVDWQSSAGYRDVIRSVGRQIEPQFDENNFDVTGG